ncbi:MAG: chromosomal replication initiator protein DnaA [Candidatus Omnitrophica bacterium]|nr:chromosomal replication initiator protein DnaA [Candidatus Omnitrophota bacterium]
MSEITDISIQIWEKTLAGLKKQVSDQTYNAWFVPITPIKLHQNELLLGLPNHFFKDWVTERYLPLMEAILGEITGEKIKISFEITEQHIPLESKESSINLNMPPSVESSSSDNPSFIKKLFSPKKIETKSIGLNPKYSFSSFVIGASNRFTHAACLAVSESPAKTYNPLFIYGGVGLGKTHLMHSIGNYISTNNPKLSIIYLSSEQFTNQLISAIQTRTMDTFRKKYRNVDILLIDDIHFIAGKEATQEEFFHTFNTLYNDHKQIVMTSDRSPKEIPALEERLVSRFEWGLVGDVGTPDFETRMAILKKKIENEHIEVPDDVLYFIADTIKTNIRELEGGLIRVIAYSKLLNQEISSSLAKEVLKGMIRENKKKINVSFIQETVAEFFSINVRDIKGKKRTKQIVFPRQIAMYLSRDLTSLSLPEIGAYFGGKDHTTVIHAYNKIDREIKMNTNTQQVIEEIRSILNQ